MSKSLERQTWQGKTHAFEGVAYRLVPEIRVCEGCVHHSDHNRCFPRCSTEKVIAIEDTPEALARYIALRMTK